MHPTTRLGLEEVLTRRATAWTAAALWAAGFVLAGLSAERMSRAAVPQEGWTRISTASNVGAGAPCGAPANDETDDDKSIPAPFDAPSGAADDSTGEAVETTMSAADPPAMFFPEDTLVVFSRPMRAAGVTQMQSGD